MTTKTGKEQDRLFDLLKITHTLVGTSLILPPNSKTEPVGTKVEVCPVTGTSKSGYCVQHAVVVL